MKELYTSPELKVVTFAPVERLANVIDFSDLLNVSQATQKPSVTPDANSDITLPIKLA